MMKPIYLLLIIFCFFGCACSTDDDVKTDPEVEEELEPITLSLNDKNATDETKALYSQLWRLQSKGVMFGHHDDLLYGREWMTEPGRSDVKEIVDDYPAVYSLDFAEIMDDRSENNSMNAERKRTIIEARNRGEVITACIHINNPLTGGDSWDNSDNTVVSKILQDGSEVNIKYKGWLDKLAAFANDLRDEEGKLIPVIFRPYHEHTQTWSWWGKSCTTQEEFISFWKFTIDYLKNEKAVHNFIYAISPQVDGPGTTDSFLFRWPGDDYVDFIGFDSYHGTNTAALSTNLRVLEALSKEKKKPVGITETGIEGIRKGDGSEYSDYWTKEMLTPIIGKEISLMVMWRNKYDPTKTGHHFYGPYAGHSSAMDFKTFYESKYTLFSKDLPNMYEIAEGVTVE